MRASRWARVLASPLTYLCIFFVFVLVMFTVLDPKFFAFRNLTGIAAAASSLGILAVGVTLALAAGSVDFSIAGNAALSAMVGALVATHTTPEIGILATVFASLTVGAIDAIIVVGFNVNPFIATLAIAGSARGVAFVLAGSSGIFIDSGPLVTVGQGNLSGVPYSVFVLIGIALVGFVVLRLTPFGRSLLAVGGNLESARLAGLRTNRIRVAGYMISSLGAGIGGMVLAGRAGVALPQAANGSELLVFSAVLLGGTSLTGGRASVVGSLLGILLLNTLYTGLILEKVSPYWQTITQGLLLVVAVWLVQLQREGRDPAVVLQSLVRRNRGASLASPGGHSK